MQTPKTRGFLAEELPQDRALRLSAERLSGAVAELPLRYAPFFRRLAQLWELPEASVERELTRAKDPKRWNRTLVRGLRSFDVKRDGPAVATRARLLHFAPGAHLPRHSHRGSETVLVLEGSYADTDGRTVHAGESQTMAEHSAHELHILGEAPCVAAVIERGIDFGLLSLLRTWV